MGRIFTRRKFVITALWLLLMVLAVGLFAWWYTSSGRLDRRLVAEMQTTLADFGARLEVGSVNTKLREQELELRDLKIYAQEGKDPVASLDRLHAKVSVSQLLGFLGFGGKGKVELQSLVVEGLRTTYKVDADGKSNLAGLHAPTRPRRVDFNYTAANVELKNAEFQFLDAPHKLAGTARNLNVKLSPDRDGYTRIVAAADQSDFTFDGRESTDIAFNVNALANEGGADIESFTLNSPLLTAEMKGTLRDWREVAYELDAKADIRTREVARLFTPQTRLSGTTRFEGKVIGKGVDYKANGKISSNDLIAEGVRIEGLDLSGTVTGKQTEYNSQHNLAVRQLEAAGFRVNRLIAAGKIAGNGEDFSWLGNLNFGEVAGPNLKARDINFREAIIKGDLARPDNLSVKGSLRIPQLVTANVAVGNLTGDVTATRDEINVPNFSGAVFGGNAKGSAKISLNKRDASTVRADLSKLSLEQAGAVAANKRLPLRGVADGRVNLSWQGNDYRSAVGSVNLQFSGATLKQEVASSSETTADNQDAAKQTLPALIESFPVSGTLNLIASDRRLRLENTTVQTGQTTITVSGDIGWDRQGVLDVVLEAADAAELKTLGLDIARIYNVDEKQLREFDDRILLTDKLSFNGRVTGALDDPRVAGRFTLGGLNVNDEYLGVLSGDVTYEAKTLRVENGRLAQTEGGSAEFALNYPFEVENGATLTAQLKNFPLATLVRQQVASIKAEGGINGEARLEGLPGAITGNADFKIANARFNGRAIDELSGKVTFAAELIQVENLKLRASGGTISGKFDFKPKTKGYRLNLKGEDMDISEIVAAAYLADEDADDQFTRKIQSPVQGRANFQIEASAEEFKLEEKQGRVFDELTATITSDELTYNGDALGKVNLTATGRDSRVQLDLKSELLGQGYTGNGEIDFSKPEIPINARVDVKETLLAPVLDLLAGEGTIKANGKTSGQLLISGNLAGKDNPVQLEAALTQLEFDIGDYKLTAQPPVSIKISNRQVEVGAARLSGANTNLTVIGLIALNDDGRNDFSLSGDVNPKILQSFVPDLFADGLIRIEAAAKGTFKQPRFSGTATLQNGSLRSPDFPLALANANGRLRFTADQAQIEKITADVGNGKVELSGGAAFAGLQPDRWRFQIKASSVRLDYPRDTRTTLDGNLVLQGNRQLQLWSGLVNVRRAEYLAEANLFEFIERIVEEFNVPSSVAAGEDSAFPPTQFDIRVVADDSIAVRTKSLDLLASAALTLKGPVDDVAVGGRVTITRGLIDDLLKERYRVTTGIVEFPGISKKPPRLNIEAESDISGYRVILLITGAADQIKITPRSEPPLPQNDVVNLIVEGRLPQEGGGIATNSQALAQSSVNTIAQLATQQLSRRIESDVTGRLFGLNRFSIDPLLTGRGTDPTARITVGRRITRDLSITYSTNVASNQDQVILIEYRASDRVTFVASRAQDGTFGLDVRLRKRF